MKKSIMIWLMALGVFVGDSMARADQSEMRPDNALTVQFDLPVTGRALKRKHGAIVTEIEAEGKKGY
ncbi:MAG: hypothetical protein JXR76_09460, partial [Deltaproteobacteria bacterium]|nr:hypothetical protein [Deltaproteobacteria bacterium]